MKTGAPDEDISIGNRFYGKYSYGFGEYDEGHTVSDSTNNSKPKYVVTEIICRKSEVTEPFLEFLHRMLSFSVCDDHKNILKIYSVYEYSTNSKSRRHEQVLSLFYEEFTEYVKHIRPRILPPILEDLKFFQIKTNFHGPTLHAFLTPKRRHEHDLVPSSARRIVEFTIFSELLDGMKFLENLGIKHGHLDTRNIVFSTPNFGFPLKIAFLQEIPNSYTDIYSLGRIFYFILETSWDSSMEESFFMWSVKRTPLRNRMIEDMDSILSKMIEVDDSKRFRSVREIGINLSAKMLDEETESVGDVLYQLMNHDPNAKEWLGNIKFLNTLGEGGFGFVTKAYNKRNGEVTAVKTLICKNDQIERMAETEYNNIKFTFHRNLVRTHQIFERIMTIAEMKSIQHRISDSSIFSSMLSGFAALNLNSSDDCGIKLICLEMEFCGHNLSHWLEHGENREDGVTQLLLIHDILEGVKFLHSKNILHRDLKPENILFFPGRVFHVKIADFGLSKILPQRELSEEPLKCACNACPCDCCHNLETTLTANIGTALYRAPEVSSGIYGKPADLYSMGLIIFEILCVIQPNNRIRTLRRLKRMAHSIIDEKKANAFVSNGKSLIIDLTQKEVLNRIQSVEQIKLITIPGFVFEPKNILELETFFKFGVTSSRIELGRVNCQKTSLLHRNDTFAVDCSFRFEGINIVEALSRKMLGVALSLEIGCLIKSTGVQDDKFIENNMDEGGRVNYFRLLFVHLQQRNITLDSLGWISPFTIEIEECLEFIGIAEFNVASENLLSYDFGNARKVKLVVDVDRCIVPSKEEDFTTYQGGTLLRDLAKKCPMIRMEGKAHLLIE